MRNPGGGGGGRGAAGGGRGGAGGGGAGGRGGYAGVGVERVRQGTGWGGDGHSAEGEHRDGTADQHLDRARAAPYLPPAGQTRIRGRTRLAECLESRAFVFGAAREGVGG